MSFCSSNGRGIRHLFSKHLEVVNQHQYDRQVMQCLNIKFVLSSLFELNG